MKILNKRNDELELENNKLKCEMKELREENIKLKVEINKLNNRLDNQDKIINKLLENKEFNKFKKAIQD